MGCRFIENPEAPIYITVGTGGAGFTHSFPTALPGWVALGAQDINGYTRFQVSEGERGKSNCSRGDITTVPNTICRPDDSDPKAFINVGWSNFVHAHVNA
jgi:hypothetical protein